MREYMGLFRGKRIDSGEWVEGNLVDCPQNFRCKRIVNFGCLSAGVITRWEQDVIPETVGECTGLKDKNGKLIFEGDLLKPFDDEIDKMVVEFYNGVFMLSLYGERGYMAEYGWEEEGNCGVFECEPLESYGADVEIIGNIHDNPELLGGAG